MIPQVRSLQDVDTLVRRRKMYAPRQRIIAFRAARKWLSAQLWAGRLDRSEAMPVQARLLLALRQEEQSLKMRKGETVERPGQSKAVPNATPAAIETANSKGIDLKLLSGTGKDGQILKKDVLAYGA